MGSALLHLTGRVIASGGYGVSGYYRVWRCTSCHVWNMYKKDDAVWKGGVNPCDNTGNDGFNGMGTWSDVEMMGLNCQDTCDNCGLDRNI